MGDKNKAPGGFTPAQEDQQHTNTDPRRNQRTHEVDQKVIGYMYMKDNTHNHTAPELQVPNQSVQNLTVALNSLT